MSVVEKYAVFCDGDAPWRGAQKPYVRKNYIAELKHYSIGGHFPCLPSRLEK